MDLGTVIPRIERCQALAILPLKAKQKAEATLPKAFLEKQSPFLHPSKRDRMTPNFKDRSTPKMRNNLWM